MNHDTASTSLDCGPKGELFLLEEVPMDQHIKSLSPGSLLDLVNSARAKILLYFPHYSDCSHQDGKLRSAYKSFPTRASTVVLQFRVGTCKAKLQPPLLPLLLIVEQSWGVNSIA